MMYSKILVPLDGSDSSLRALHHAVNLAKIHDSEIIALSVIDELKLPFGAQYRLWANESHQELIRDTLESINKEIANIKQQEPAIVIDAEILEGDPAKTIIEQSKDYDLVVMGKRGMGVIEELVMGSVTNRVVNNTTVPVTVVA